MICRCGRVISPSAGRADRLIAQISKLEKYAEASCWICMVDKIILFILTPCHSATRLDINQVTPCSAAHESSPRQPRSEESRVGKECED